MTAGRRARAARFFLLGLLVVAMLAAAWFLFFDPRGRVLVQHPDQLEADVRGWVRGHWLIAPLICILAYVTFAMCALPVWWILVLAGYGFGIALGIVIGDLSAATAAMITVMFSRYLAADWFHAHVESKLSKLRELDEKLGHNGLLVVIGVRLAHFLPFGLSNYAFGLTRVSAIDAFVGTLIGALPSVTFYVIAGAAPHLLKDWRFIVIFGAVNLLMLTPVLLRYLKPEWFKKIGIE